MTENIVEMSQRKMQFRRKVRSLIGPFVLRRMRNVVARRSLTGAQDLGARLGACGRYVSAHRYRLAIANLRVVFGDTKS